MLTEFVLVSFASFIGWQMFRNLTFFPFSLRLAPFVSVGISFLFTLLMKPSLLIAFAASGGVVVLIKVTEVTSPEVLRFSRRTRRSQSEVGSRIPSL